VSPAESPPVPPATTVLVSGASRGLGLALVRELAGQGLRVAGFARTVGPELERLAALHPGLVVGAVDLTDGRAVERFVDQAADRLGHGFDGLVNNAATGQSTLLPLTTPEEIERIITTDLVAPLLLIRHFTRELLADGGRGRIVTITSYAAQRGFPGHTVYAAAKAGLEGATRSLARELRDRLLANCVAPGLFRSELTSGLDESQIAAILRRAPLHRLPRPEDIVPVVRFLLTEASAITGQVLTVDAGLSV